MEALAEAKVGRRPVPLLHSNCWTQIRKPFLAALGLPEVTPHSARHSYISNLQAEGIEVGLMAKLAGHSNPAVTLGIYTQAMRGGGAAAEALERAYARRFRHSVSG